MDSATRLLTTAGMVKIPFVISDNLDKIRLYYCVNQHPEEMRKIQTLFECEMKGSLYKGEIFQFTEHVQSKPYLLKEGKMFQLISIEHVFELQEKYLISSQDVIQFYKKILDISLKWKDYVNEQWVYLKIGNAYQRLEDYRNSIPYQERALKSALERNDVQGEGSIYGNLGAAYDGLGNYREAILYQEQALKIALELNDSAYEGRTYGKLGAAYRGLGDYRRAITYHKKELKIALELNNLDFERGAYCSLGMASDWLGDYRSAIMYHEKALEIDLELKDRVGEGMSYSNLGIVCYALGDYRGAMTYHQKRLKIALELNDLRGEGAAYGNLGMAYQGLKDYRGAITYHEKHLKIALELNDLIIEGKIYGNLGTAYQGLRDYRGAITYYEKDLKSALERNDRVSAGRTYGNLGIAYLELREEAKAEEYLCQSIKISAILHHQVQEPKWQVSFFEEQSLSYIRLEQARLQQNKLHQALETSDMRRARALSSLISRNPSLIYQKNISETFAIQKMQHLANKFHTHFIIYSSLSINRTNPFVQACVISSEGEPIPSRALPLSDKALFNPEHIFKSFPYQIETTYPRRGEKQPAEAFQEKLSSFYRCLIAPLEEYLPLKDSGKTLTFIPDGFLTHLPFGTFYNEEEDKYLIENYPVSVAPSIEVLSLLDALPNNHSKEALLLGNPTTLAREADELQVAEKEVCSIVAPMLKISQDEVFIQERATPMCVLNQASNDWVIHIACHGEAYLKPLEKPDPHSVFEGLLRLAPDEDHPLGHLHAKEIAEMSLKADLVFMSACHLGRGNLKQEGSVGPVWSFLGAGAKSVIASYWPLPEGEMTVKMVETFYTHYLGKDTPKLSKSQALQQAALMAMKEEGEEPPAVRGAVFIRVN